LTTMPTVTTPLVDHDGMLVDRSMYPQVMLHVFELMTVVGSTAIVKLIGDARSWMASTVEELLIIVTSMIDEWIAGTVDDGISLLLKQ
jgi:hypothetical protein